jgi:molybdenum cofactor biosynthesis protein B
MLINETKSLVPVRIALLTISDTVHPEKDETSKALAKRIAQFKHSVTIRSVSRAVTQEVTSCLDAWIDRPDIDVIISIGATGLTRGDVAIEAHLSLYEREIEGFTHLFYQNMFKKVGAAAMSMCACGGICGSTLLFALPGCLQTCLFIWDSLLSKQLDKQYKPHNLINIIPHL